MKGKNKYLLFEEIYKEYVKAIFRFVYLRVSDRLTAQDITAETYTHIWKLILKETNVENPKALLYVIARGLIVDYYRSNKYKKKVSIKDTETATDDSQSEMIEQINKKQELAIIYAKLKKLKHEYQEIILLRYVEDLSIPEIAAIVNKKENAVRVLLYRALHALKKKV